MRDLALSGISLSLSGYQRCFKTCFVNTSVPAPHKGPLRNKINPNFLEQIKKKSKKRLKIVHHYQVLKRPNMT